MGARFTRSQSPRQSSLNKADYNCIASRGGILYEQGKFLRTGNDHRSSSGEFGRETHFSFSAGRDGFVLALCGFLKLLSKASSRMHRVQ